MEIMRIINAKSKDAWNQSGVTFAFLGDSITQGCFEVYGKDEHTFDVVYDYEHGYHYYLKQLLEMLYPNVPINIINAGISGSNAPHGLERIDRDVLCHRPDIVVVCFGVNDSVNSDIELEDYISSLRQIFEKLQEQNIETIFMTPNMMNTSISHFTTDPLLKTTAETTCRIQNEGVMDQYMEAAIALCNQCGVVVCDCYHKWKILERNGVDITGLLANKINHPTRKMNWLFAVSLLETMLETSFSL